ncbi:hypothetical protein DYB38_010673, partial [Aphanomyces astaci]
MRQEMSTMAAQQETLQKDRFSTLHDVVAQIQSEQQIQSAQPGVNTPVQPRIRQNKDEETKSGRRDQDQAAGRGVYLIEPNEITSDDEDTQLIESESDPGSNGLGAQITQPSQFTTEFRPEETRLTTMGENPDENSLVKTKGRRLIKESETRTEAYILRSPYEDRGAQETSKGEACWKTTTDSEDRVEIQEDSPRGPVCDEKEKKPDEAAAPTRVQGTSATCGEETRKFPRSAEEACQSGSMPATCGGETLNNPQLAEETCQRGKIPGMCGSEGTTTSEKDPEAGAQPLRIQIGRREGASEEVGAGQDKDNSVEDGAGYRQGARETNENASDQARETNGAPADEAVPNKMEDAINDSVPHDPRDPVKVAQVKVVEPFPQSTSGEKGQLPSEKLPREWNNSPPVFSPEQIEAIVRGDFDGLADARHVDIEDRLYPITQDELKAQVQHLRNRRRDVTHEEIASVITNALRRPLTEADKDLFLAPADIDNPRR